jgi:dienelactone hydrolase
MSDKVIAKPSEACCLRGKIHTGDPKGNIVEIEGVETYVSEPPAGKANGNVLLYFPDVYGLFINGKLIMDAFAAAGYLTLGPDYFRGVSSACDAVLLALRLIHSLTLTRIRCISIRPTRPIQMQTPNSTLERGLPNIKHL